MTIAEVELRTLNGTARRSSITIRPGDRGPGDVDGDGFVGFEDFFLFADFFGTSKSSDKWNPVFDFDGNGAVDFDDFFIFADNFGKRY